MGLIRALVTAMTGSQDDQRLHQRHQDFYHDKTHQVTTPHSTSNDHKQQQSQAYGSPLLAVYEAASARRGRGCCSQRKWERRVERAERRRECYAPPRGTGSCGKSRRRSNQDQVPVVEHAPPPMASWTPAQPVHWAPLNPQRVASPVDSSDAQSVRTMPPAYEEVIRSEKTGP